MTASELELWWFAYCLEPWGEKRGDLRMGILAATTANMWLGKGQKRLTPADFMPRFEPVRSAQTRPLRGRQSPQHMFAVLMEGTRAVGGKIDPKLLAAS